VSGSRSRWRWRGRGWTWRSATTARGARRAGHANLADPTAARRLVEQAARAFGGLDVLVNSAAIFERTPFAITTVARYDRLLALNLRAAFFCAQTAAAVMRRGGHIVNIGDAGAAGPRPNYIPYTLAKVGIESLTRGRAVALRSRRIAVNCVAPGAVLRPPGFSAARWRRVTRGHAGSVADVAAAVLFLATSPRYITRQMLKVDGGEGVTS
jgi:NAD(P)-dependent dehydrogenase (short-subunit alcohol dehydrogenase family)